MTELLLPLEEFRELARGERLPHGARIISPLVWYYRRADVKRIQITGGLVYAVRLPLVTGRDMQAVEVRSYPVPNPHGNMTIRFKVQNYVYFDPSSGLTQSLRMDACVGNEPIVCYRSPETRSTNHARTCTDALFMGDDVMQLCKVMVSKRTMESDQFIYHDINDYILVTWGTRLTDQCDRTRARPLDPGVYRVRWSGQCSVCSAEVCVPGLRLLHSAFNFTRWRPMDVDGSLPNPVSELKVKGIATLSPPEHSQLVDLNGLLTATEPPLTELSLQHQSLIGDVSIATFLLFFLLAGLLGLCMWRRRCCRADKTVAVDEGAIEMTPVPVHLR